MPRYVILHHVTPSHSERLTHWDFMLESHGVLRTWVLEQPPRMGQSMVAHALPDHRIEYLTYEGPVSGERGHVTRWDRGDCTSLNDQDGYVVVELRGDRLRCELALTRDRDHTQRWHFRFGEKTVSPA